MPSLAVKLHRSAGIPVTAAVKRLLTEADRARDLRDWTRAAEIYQKALDRDPSLGHIWIQLGHALKEALRLREAETAYVRAAALGSADAQLHLAHLRRRQGDLTGATRAFLAAARLDPAAPEALNELHRMIAPASDVRPQDLLKILDPSPPPETGGIHEALKAASEAIARLQTMAVAEGDSAALPITRLDDAARLIDEFDRALRRSDSRADAGPPLVFDVSDLIAYFRDSRLPTGIQRVQIEIVREALALPEAGGLRVCTFDARRDTWLELPPSLLQTLFQLSLSGGDRSAPEWLAALTRVQLLLHTAESFTFPSGAWLVNLGTSWWIPNYFLAVRQAVTADGAPVRYVPFIHDFIPLRAPHVCAKGLTEEFVAWTVSVFDHAQVFLVNSEATRRDLMAVADLLGRPIADDAVQVICLDADARKPHQAPARRAGLATWGLNRTPYVLFVGTFEARKNHVLAFEAWLDLIRLHGVNAVPKLVCVGKRGWLDDAIHAKLAAHEDLRDRVVLLSSISDAELAELYRGCICTLYPSSFEGWGLPVTESLCHGKVPVISNSSSLPEAGGKFAVYFEAGSSTRLSQALDRLIYDAPYRIGVEAMIAREFKPRRWADLARQVMTSVEGWAETAAWPGAWSTPCATLGAYHPLQRNAATQIWLGRRSTERFRTGPGWWGQDDFGCWTKPEGGELVFALAGPHVPLRVYVRVQGLPSQACEAHLDVDGFTSAAVTALQPNQVTWMVAELPASKAARPIHRLLLQGDRAEDLTERTSGQDGRVISVGFGGFFVCEADDAAARAAFSEAVALGQLDSIGVNFKPPRVGTYAPAL